MAKIIIKFNNDVVDRIDLKQGDMKIGRKPGCEIHVDNLSPDCAKNFTAEWKCGAAETVYAVSVPSGAARGEPLRLACTAFQ